VTTDCLLLSAIHVTKKCYREQFWIRKAGQDLNIIVAYCFNNIPKRIIYIVSLTLNRLRDRYCAVSFSFAFMSYIVHVYLILLCIYAQYMHSKYNNNLNIIIAHCCTSVWLNRPWRIQGDTCHSNDVNNFEHIVEFGKARQIFYHQLYGYFRFDSNITAVSVPLHLYTANVRRNPRR